MKLSANLSPLGIALQIVFVAVTGGVVLADVPPWKAPVLPLAPAKSPAPEQSKSPESMLSPPAVTSAPQDEYPTVIYSRPVPREKLKQSPGRDEDEDRNDRSPEKLADHRRSAEVRKDGNGERDEARRKEEPGDDDHEGDVAPKIPTVRAPRAEEVGRKAKGTDSITPEPGLPLDMSFDAVSWVLNGMSPGDNGDLNIAPDNPTAGNVTALAPSPVNSNVLYVGTANGGVWRTNNALAAAPHWLPMTDDQMSLSIGGLAMDTSDSTGNTLVAGIGRRSSYSKLGGAQVGILRTVNGGTTWTLLGGTNIYGTGTGLGFSDYTSNFTGVGTFHTIEFMTLPDGNALMVGTDLGVFMMRLSAPGVWTTIGDNLPHVPVFDANFDPAGQVLAVSTLGRGTWLFDCKRTKATGQYGETFQAFVAGTTVLPTRTGDLFSAQLGTATGVVDSQVRELQLTASGVSQMNSAFRLPDMNPGRAVGAFSAKWNGLVYGPTNQIGNGFSLNFGAFGAYTSSNFTASTNLNEDGFGIGLSIGVRTFTGNTPGYYVRVNGAVVPGGFVSKASSAWTNAGQTRHFFEVDWRNDLGLTLRVDGVAIFTNLPTPGYLPASGDRFVFAARCGANTEDIRLDNIAVFTGGVLSPIAPTAPYYASADDPADGEGAAQAFDGNANTQWLSADYSGSIGATLPAAKTVRLYTLTSANATRQRDPFIWDFQTSNNGTNWAQHGVQGEQYFVFPLEERAFVVANPVASTAFRALITANRDDPDTSLAEFQPWEFIPVVEQFSVANLADSGAGSLRQAVSDAAAFDGPPVVTFASSLAGQTLTLSGGPIAITNPAGIIIDGTSIGGATISANNLGRIFTINAGATTLLKNLTLTGGNATGSFPNSYGGAIYNQSVTTLINCTLSGNHASVAGGAIYNQAGTLDLFNSTISGNTAQYGGAIQNEGSFYCASSTLANNTVTVEGGAVSSPNNHGNFIVQSTISGNAAPNGGGLKGTSFTVEYSILAGNTATMGPDYSDPINQASTPNIVGTPPLLAPLDNYGGPTKTMALLPGSPARNAATGDTVTSDQRGFPIVGTPDLGAYEAGTFTNYNAFIWESLPAAATVAQHAATADYDGDGVSNYNEWLALTDPTDPKSSFRISNVVRDGPNIDLTFPTVLGRTYYIDYGTDLAGWTTAGSLSGTGGIVTVPVGPVTGSTKLFFRVRVGP